MSLQDKYEVEIRKVQKEKYIWLVVSGHRQIRVWSKGYGKQGVCEKAALRFTSDFQIKCIRRIDGEPSIVLYNPFLHKES